MAASASQHNDICLNVCDVDELSVQDLIARLLERKPTRRLGMLAGKAADVKRHKWFDSIDWAALEARRVEPPRKPRDDSAKRLKELQARRESPMGLPYYRRAASGLRTLFLRMAMQAYEAMA